MEINQCSKHSTDCRPSLEYSACWEGKGGGPRTRRAQGKTVLLSLSDSRDWTGPQGQEQNQDPSFLHCYTNPLLGHDGLTLQSTK